MGNCKMCVYCQNSSFERDEQFNIIFSQCKVNDRIVQIHEEIECDDFAEIESGCNEKVDKTITELLEVYKEVKGNGITRLLGL